MRLRLTEIASCMGAIGDIARAQDCEVFHVQTDSRLVRPGDLFICLVGRKMDGHVFAAEAASKGACAIVAHSPLSPGDLGIPVLLVRNTHDALSRLALYWRTTTKATVIGITGSAGKTTVKEMLASVLSQEGETAKNFKNWNNQIGLPLSMLACSGEERFWVMELGISRPGDMEELGAVLRPDHVLIINAGPCHLEGLGDVQGVARAKAKLLETMMPGGTAVVSSDYPALVEAVGHWDGEPVFFSTQETARDAWGRYVGNNDQGLGSFCLAIAGQSHDVILPAHGRDMAENAIAVATLAQVLGLGSETIVQGLKKYVPVEQRFTIFKHGSWTVIDDTYNANPLSMQRSIERASQLQPDQPLVMVLGEMKELGSYTHKAHTDLGTWVGASSCCLLCFAGNYADAVHAGLGAWDGHFVSLDSPHALKAQVARLPSGGTILFKGSRSCQMERYLQVFMENLG